MKVTVSFSYAGQNGPDEQRVFTGFHIDCDENNFAGIAA